MDILIATEDELSDTVLRHLIATFRTDVTGITSLGRRGNMYLRSKMRSFCEIARNTQPVIVLTDLDRTPCPINLIKSWLPMEQLPANLLFRVAVREVESWIMADREGFSKHLGIPIQKIPFDTDQISDPKQTLMNLAKKGKNRKICKDIYPETGVVASQGIGYNQVLSAFVTGVWDCNSAANSSQSLKRTLARLEKLSTGSQ